MIFGLYIVAGRYFVKSVFVGKFQNVFELYGLVAKHAWVRRAAVFINVRKGKHNFFFKSPGLVQQMKRYAKPVAHSLRIVCIETAFFADHLQHNTVHLMSRLLQQVGAHGRIYTAADRGCCFCHNITVSMI